MHIQDMFVELEDTLQTAQMDLGIFSVYIHPKSKIAFKKATETFPFLFETSRVAHFCSGIIGLYRLYEPVKNKTSLGIPALLEKLEKEFSISEDILEKLHTLRRETEPIHKKITLIRHEAFAHQSMKNHFFESFERSGLNLNDTDKLIDVSKELLKQASLAVGRRPRPLVHDLKNQTIALLSLIEKYGDTVPY